MSCLSHHPFDWAFDTPSVKNMEDSVWFNLFSELYYSVYLSEGIMFSVRNDICVSFLHPHAWSTCDPKFVHFFTSTLLVLVHVIFINIKIPGNKAFCLLVLITNLNAMSFKNGMFMES